MKTRIVERTYGWTCEKKYIIQEKHWLLGWVDAWSKCEYYNIKNTFNTLEEAINHLPLFRQEIRKDKVVY